MIFPRDLPVPLFAITQVAKRKKLVTREEEAKERSRRKAFSKVIYLVWRARVCAFSFKLGDFCPG